MTFKMPSYNFNASEGSYWITLPVADTSDETKCSFAEQKPLPSGKLTYKSDTGQFLSNCFFFVEGIDSSKVADRLNRALETIGSLVSHSDVENLENQDLVASYVFKYVIQNNSCSVEVLDRCLKYLSSTSEYFNKKVGGGRVTSSKRSDSRNHISRCSYKFCIHTYCCQYNYPESGKHRKRENKGCYSDHYVHGKVNQDITSLRNYINNLCKENGETKTIVIRNNQEIIKCINTIAYVIKHMYDELWNIYISCNRDKSYETLHRNIF